MKKQIYFIFSFFILSLLLIGSASALSTSTDWNKYGGSETSYISNSQSTEQNYFQNSINALTVPYNGFSTPWNNALFGVASQLKTINFGNVQYIFATASNNLNVYDANLVSLNSIPSEEQKSDLTLYGKNATTISISGIFANSSNTYFKVYYYNVVSNTFSEGVSVPLDAYGGIGAISCTNSTLYTNYNGIVCIGTHGAFGGNHGLIKYYEDGSIINYSLVLPTSYGGVTVSLLDANQNGHLNALIVTSTDASLYDINGTLIWDKPITGSSLIDAKFFKANGIYKVALINGAQYYYGGGSGQAVAYLTTYNMDGSTYHSGIYLFNSGYLTNKTGLMAVTTNGLNSNILVAVSGTGGTYVYRYNYDSTLLQTAHTSQVAFGGLGDQASGSDKLGSVIDVGLDWDLHDVVILNPDTRAGTWFMLNLNTSFVMATATGQYVVSDINKDGVVELIGYDNNNMIEISSTGWTPQTPQNVTQTGNAGVTYGVATAVLGVFPAARTLTSGEKIVYILVTMFLTFFIFLALVLFSGEGVHEAVWWVLLILEVMLVVFFIVIQYISLVLMVGVGAVVLITAYFIFRRKGG